MKNKIIKRKKTSAILSIIGIIPMMVMFTNATAPLKMEVGIAQSDLVWHKDDSLYSPETMITDMADSSTKWLRTNMRSASLSQYFAQLVKKANDSGMKVVATILHEADDYLSEDLTSERAFGSQFNDCGWTGRALKLSQINLPLYKIRLKTYLDSLVVEGADVSAFEIGNELDWHCFNGDIPVDGTTVNSEDSSLNELREKYSQMIKVSSELIKTYPQFSKSKIFSFGVANCSIFSNANCLSDPYNFLKLMDESTKNQIDAYAIHIYPQDLNNVKQSTLDLLEKYRSVINDSKPFALTEGGFPISGTAPNSLSSSTLYDTFLNALKDSGIVSHAFVYTYFSYYNESYALKSSLIATVDESLEIINKQYIVKNGSCNNDIQWGCTVGNVGTSNGLTSLGTTLTWTCAGVNGGTTDHCSRINDGRPAPKAGVCNNAVQWGCSSGTVGTSNGITTLGATLTWTCVGSNGGATSQCSRFNDGTSGRPSDGICNNVVQWGCSSGTVGTSNGITTLGAILTWTCVGSNGGATSQCSRVNNGR